MGGRGTDIAGVPGDPNLVYIANGGGGLFKTADSGGHLEAALRSRKHHLHRSRCARSRIIPT
jgi:hypothetical protein